MYSKTAIITFFAGFAAAQIHAPVGEPAGNPITRPLIEVSTEPKQTNTRNNH